MVHAEMSSSDRRLARDRHCPLRSDWPTAAAACRRTARPECRPRLVLTKCSDTMPALRRHQRPIADAAQMPGVAQGDDGNAVPPALVDAELHRLLADGLAEAELPIDDGDGVVLEGDLDRSPREHLAGFEPLT